MGSTNRGESHTGQGGGGVVVSSPYRESQPVGVEYHALNVPSIYEHQMMYPGPTMPAPPFNPCPRQPFGRSLRRLRQSSAVTTFLGRGGARSTA
jgi:hypothetical protein